MQKDITKEKKALTIFTNNNNYYGLSCNFHLIDDNAVDDIFHLSRVFVSLSSIL